MILSICTQILVFFTVLVLGRLNSSVGWIIVLIVALIKGYITRRQEIQQVVINARRSMKESDNIDSRFGSFEEIPSWVMFPDVERVEWVNILLKLFWPKINVLAVKSLRDLQPRIRKQVLFKRFMFNKIDLGKNVRSFVILV